MAKGCTLSWVGLGGRVGSILLGVGMIVRQVEVEVETRLMGEAK